MHAVSGLAHLRCSFSLRGASPPSTAPIALLKAPSAAIWRALRPTSARGVLAMRVLRFRWERSKNCISIRANNSWNLPDFHMSILSHSSVALWYPFGGVLKMSLGKASHRMFWTLPPSSAASKASANNSQVARRLAKGVYTKVSVFVHRFGLLGWCCRLSLHIIIITYTHWLH
jgi:hypothetical protein